MTGYISETNYLSKLSLAALVDIGYGEVDMSVADPYTPPAACCGSNIRRNLRQRDLQARRPPLSQTAQNIARAHGLAQLEKARLPPGAQREINGLTYVGDLSVSVLMEENGFIYGVEVTP